jgi:hypothetical protein
MFLALEIYFSFANYLYVILQFLLETSSREDPKRIAELGNILTVTNSCVAATNHLLNKMKSDTDLMRLESPNRPQEPAIRDNLTRELLSEFVETTNSFQTAVKKFKVDVENVVRKEVLTRMPNASDDDIHTALDCSRTLKNVEDNSDPSPRPESVQLNSEYVASSVMKSIVDSVTVKYPALDHLDHALEDLHHSFYYSFLAAQAKRDRTSILSTAENSQECSLRDLIDQEISADFEKRRLYRTLRIGGGVLSVVGVIIFVVYICAFRNF